MLVRPKSSSLTAHQRTHAAMPQALSFLSGVTPAGRQSSVQWLVPHPRVYVFVAPAARIVGPGCTRHQAGPVVQFSPLFNFGGSLHVQKKD